MFLNDVFRSQPGYDGGINIIVENKVVCADSKRGIILLQKESNVLY
jgi:hypothetical protein